MLCQLNLKMQHLRDVTRVSDLLWDTCCRVLFEPLHFLLHLRVAARVHAEAYTDGHQAGLGPGPGFDYRQFSQIMVELLLMFYCISGRMTGISIFSPAGL